MFRYVLLSIAAFSILSSVPAVALTLKSGEVIGSDGNIYVGASPENAANLKGSGVVGRNLFIEVNGKVTFVPLTDLAGKSKETVKEIIISAIMTGGETINLSDAQDVEQLDTQAQTLIENAEFASAAADFDAAVAAAEAAGEEVSLDDIQAAVDAGILEVEGGIDALIESAAINEAVEQASSELDAAVAAYEAGVADGSIDPATTAHPAAGVDLSAY